VINTIQATVAVSTTTERRQTVTAYIGYDILSVVLNVESVSLMPRKLLATAALPCRCRQAQTHTMHIIR
jgi:hypothetical protein